MKAIDLKQAIEICKQPFVYVREKLRPKTTYSQHNEDLVLRLLLGNVDRFIDVGANNGRSASNTFLFAIQGATGLCFEPVPLTYSLLSSLYLLNRKVRCFQVAISDKDGFVTIQEENLLSFIPETQDPWGKAHLTKFMSGVQHLVKVKCSTLRYWIDRFPTFCLTDVISIDVEGHELSVLNGIDFESTHAKCIVIETMKEMHQDYHEITAVLSSYGYKSVLRNSMNTFWFTVNSCPDGKALLDICTSFPGYEILL